MIERIGNVDCNLLLLSELNNRFITFMKCRFVIVDLLKAHARVYLSQPTRLRICEHKRLANKLVCDQECLSMSARRRKTRLQKISIS